MPINIQLIIVFEKVYYNPITNKKAIASYHEQTPSNKKLKQCKYGPQTQSNFKVVLKGILSKYDSQFNFVSSKSIMQLVFDHTLSPDVIAFKDVMVFIERNQYMKRFYFVKNSYGRNQIEQRIKTLANFYAENVFLSFQYPTMILSKTKQIFQRRLKRIKRCENGYDSSNDDDQDEQKQSLPPICGSFSYLKQQPSEVIQKISEKNDESGDVIRNILDESRYSSSVHDAYQDFQDDKNTEHQVNKIKKAFDISSVFPLEKQISHLIYDFQDLDELRIKRQYQALQKKDYERRQQTRNMVNKFETKNGLTNSNKQIQSPKNTSKHVNTFNNKIQPKKNQPHKNQTNHPKISVNQLNQSKQSPKCYISGIGSPKNSQFARLCQKHTSNKMLSDHIRKQQPQGIKMRQEKSNREIKIQQILQKHRKNSQNIKQQTRKLDQIQQRKRQIDYLKLKQNNRGQLQISRQNKQGQNGNSIKILQHVKSQTRLKDKMQAGKKLDLNKLIVTFKEPNVPVTNKSTIVLNHDSQQEQNIRFTDSDVKIGSPSYTKNSYSSSQMRDQIEQNIRAKFQGQNSNFQNKTGYTYMNRPNQFNQNEKSQAINLNKSENNYNQQASINKNQPKYSTYKSGFAKEEDKIMPNTQTHNTESYLLRQTKLFKHVKSTDNLEKICFQDGGTYKEYKTRWKN